MSFEFHSESRVTVAENGVPVKSGFSVDHRSAGIEVTAVIFQVFPSKRSLVGDDAKDDYDAFLLSLYGVHLGLDDGYFPKMVSEVRLRIVVAVDEYNNADQHPE